MSKRQRRVREKQARHTAGSAARSLGSSAGLAVAATLLSGSVAEAATYTVTDGTDSLNAVAANCTAGSTADPHCRLRDAITAANGTPGSTILFGSSLSGSTISLAGQLPGIYNAMTIQGPGASQLTLNGNLNGRIFLVATSGAVDISGLTATNGYSTQGPGGGAILENGSGPLTLTGVALLNNTTYNGNGGGLEQQGNGYAVVQNSVISGNQAIGSGKYLSGGGIASTNQLTVKNSTISGNSSQFRGGGIQMASGSVSGSTISGNQAAGPAGGLSSSSSVTIADSTIANNVSKSAGGGLSLPGNGAKLWNSTVFGNTARSQGGGVQATGKPVMASSVVAGNKLSAPGATSADVNGAVSESFSLIQNPAGNADSSGSTTNLNGMDPKLCVLASNGGVTQTVKPLPSSPLVDKGKDFTGTGLDQRGLGIFDQPAVPNAAGGDGRDIGAVELQATEFTGPASCPVPPAPPATPAAPGPVSSTGPSTATTTVTTTAPPIAPPGIPDDVALKILQAPLSNVSFSSGGGLLSFTDQAPEAGTEAYVLQMVLGNTARVKRVTLGNTTVKPSKAQTQRVSIRLSRRARKLVKKHPRGRLIVRTYFVVGGTSHHLNTTRNVRPKHRPH